MSDINNTFMDQWKLTKCMLWDEFPSCNKKCMKLDCEENFDSLSSLLGLIELSIKV